MNTANPPKMLMVLNIEIIKCDLYRGVYSLQSLLFLKKSTTNLEIVWDAIPETFSMYDEPHTTERLMHRYAYKYGSRISYGFEKFFTSVAQYGSDEDFRCHVPTETNDWVFALAGAAAGRNHDRIEYILSQGNADWLGALDIVVRDGVVSDVQAVVAEARHRNIEIPHRQFLMLALDRGHTQVVEWLLNEPPHRDYHFYRSNECRKRQAANHMKSISLISAENLPTNMREMWRQAKEAVDNGQLIEIMIAE